MKMDMSAKTKMDTSETFESSTTDIKFEAKFSKIPNKFSIESLIAKRTSLNVEMDEDNTGLNEQNTIDTQDNNYPLLPFPPNFPLYNPWVSYLSQTNVCLNLFPNGQHPQQQQQHQQQQQQQQQLQQLQNDKLAQFLDTTALINNGCKDKISELLFNPLTQLSQVHSSTYLQQQQQQQHHHEQFLLNNKFKDNYFLNEFYNNYLLSENNKYLQSANNNVNNNNSKKNNKKSNKRNAIDIANEQLVDTNDIDVDGDSFDGAVADCTQSVSRTDCDESSFNKVDEESSYSDLSVTLSPSDLNQQKLDKGKNIYIFIFELRKLIKFFSTYFIRIIFP